MDRRMSVMQRRSRLTNSNEEEDDECIEKSNSNRLDYKCHDAKTYYDILTVEYHKRHPLHLGSPPSLNHSNLLIHRWSLKFN